MSIVYLAAYRASRKPPPGRYSSLAKGMPVRKNGLVGEILSFERTWRDLDLFQVAWENGTRTIASHRGMEVLTANRITA